MLQAAGSRRIFWENTATGFLTPLPQAPCLGGDQPWWLLARARLFLPACRMPGKEARQHVPWGCRQHAPSGALQDMGELCRGPSRMGINTGTILVQLKAADETPGRRLGSLPTLPHASAEYHPLLRASDRRLQGTVPFRRVPEHPVRSSPARKGTILIPEAGASTSCYWTLTSPCWPALSGPSGSTGDDEGNSLVPGGRSRRHEIGQ